MNPLRICALLVLCCTVADAFSVASVRRVKGTQALSTDTRIYSSTSYLDSLDKSKTKDEAALAGTFVNETAMLEKSTFPIKPAKLIELTKDALRKGAGTVDSTVLADDFEFCAPVVGPLKKKEYLGALENFKLLDAFPDLDSRYYNIHVDPFEYNRVWWHTRPIATHTGSLFGKKPSGKKLELPPQANSFTFNEEGKVTQMTIGYVLDRRVGNTGGLGGAFGFFYGVGQPLPIPECHPYKKSFRFRLLNWIGKLARIIKRKKED